MNESLNNFYDLKVWQEAHRLTIIIYKTTKSFPKSEVYGLTSQICRSSTSITSNIAEGFARYHPKDKARFYTHARGSAAGTHNFLLLAKSLGYIKKDLCQELTEKCQEIEKMINGLIKSIDKNR